jgi:arginine/lysine/ornithine decarboxylase
VDNAHGAYLQFLSPSLHPIAQGADICCDSAHKTLPVLTGGAYLHLSPRMPRALISLTKTALTLFGSTSPSYLILQSLDAANAALESDVPARLAALVGRLDCLKARLAAHGYTLLGNEPLKLTILPKSFGYDGHTLAATLRERGVECEFCDPDALVLMPSVGNSECDLDRLERALLSIVRRQAITDAPPPIPRPARVMSVRAAMLAPCEWVAAPGSLGRILSAPSVGCPPAVPIVMSGERIDADAIDCFSYYGIERCLVVK